MASTPKRRRDHGLYTEQCFPNLSLLTSTTYTHKFYVDGTATAGDAFFNNDWHTILVGSLDKGGPGIYALDVTDPSSFSEASPTNLLLWEFTDSTDADLGYTYSHPAIVRMANGKWAAVFGNGYNNTTADGHASTTGRAVLYIAFINEGRDGVWTSGTDYIKIDTKVGSTTTPNGLATVDPVDLNGDNIVDAIYAGDLQGNMWKFDVSNTNSAQWKVAYGTASVPAPLFTASRLTPAPPAIVSRSPQNQPSIQPRITSVGYWSISVLANILKRQTAISTPRPTVVLRHLGQWRYRLRTERSAAANNRLGRNDQYHQSDNSTLITHYG